MSAKIAILIDAENISHRDLPRVLEEVPRYGQIVLQAVYGDWENPAIQKWREIAEVNHFKIRHQTNHAPTKNSSDMRLIMDAMEVMFHTAVDTFCLVTNDADYVPLCDKLRESGKEVIGLGYRNASGAFIRACDKFIFIDEQSEPPTPPLLDPPQPVVPPKSASQPNVRELVAQAFAQAPHDSKGWVGLPALGEALRQVQPGFQNSTYGRATLSKLLQTMPDFVELQTKGSSKVARLKNGKGH